MKKIKIIKSCKIAKKDRERESESFKTGAVKYATKFLLHKNPKSMAKHLRWNCIL